MAAVTVLSYSRTDTGPARIPDTAARKAGVDRGRAGAVVFADRIDGRANSSSSEYGAGNSPGQARPASLPEEPAEVSWATVPSGGKGLVQGDSRAMVLTSPG